MSELNSGIPGSPEGSPEQDVAAQLAAGQAEAGVGVGATGVDIAALLEQIEAYKAATDARISQLEREKRAGAGVPPLISTVQSLTDLLGLHASQSPGTDHAEALNLAADLKEAAADAVSSGDPQHVSVIGGKLARWLGRHHTGSPFEAQLADFAGPHLADAVETLEAPAGASTAIGSSRAPVKVTAGNVIAG